jgi:hypothetical protein
MNRNPRARRYGATAHSPRTLRYHASAVAAFLAAAGFVLAGCGSSGSGSSGPASSGGSSGGGAASSSASSPASSGSGGSGASSASVPFPVAVGDTWTYRSNLGAKVVNTMTAVTPVSGGQKVTMTTATTVDGSTTSSTGYYIFNSDGSITVPFSQFNTGSTSATVKLISGSVFWPPAAQIASGQAQQSTLAIDYTVAGHPQRVDAHVTVKGDGTGTVTVPAGTYSGAQIVTMTMRETIDGYAVSIEVKTWLAAGVGPVQTEAIVGEGGTDHLVAKNELVSFTKG